jgi:hypothetical protein
MLRTIVAALLFSLTACSADTVTMFFTALPKVNENGTYNGFSTATVNGDPSQLLICDDYNDETIMPSSSNMVYDYSTLTGADPLQYAMFDKSKYDEAALLAYELAQIPTASADIVTDYQYALWNLMTPSARLDPSRVAQEQAIQNNALAMVNNPAQAQFLVSTVYAYTEIYTPTAAYAGNQEFLEYATPEPNLGWTVGFLLLLGAVGLKVQRNTSTVQAVKDVRLHQPVFVRSEDQHAPWASQGRGSL